MSVPQTPIVCLVDFDGTPVPPADATTWPGWTDSFFWCADDAITAELEVDEMEALDADGARPMSSDELFWPDGDASQSWAHMMVEASIPPVFTPSAQDWEDYYANRGD